MPSRKMIALKLVGGIPLATFSREQKMSNHLSASISVEQSQSISPQSRSQSRPTNPLARKRGTSQFPVLESRHFSRRSSHQGVFELLLQTHMSATPRYAYWFRFRSEVAEARETYFPRFAPSAVHFFLSRSRSYFSKRWLLFQRLWGCSAPISNLLPGRVRPKKESNNIIPFGI